MAAKDMTGQRFGLLSVIERATGRGDGTAYWVCQCDCGEKRVVAGTGLRAGRNKSCGCNSPRFTPVGDASHGMVGTRTHAIWRGMLSRCSDRASGKSRRNYYDRGIRVCERWMDFRLFLDDMGQAPDGMSIDRINGSLGYAPENCRWATPKEQANNTRSNRLVEFDGRTQTVSQWAEEVGINQNTLLHRLRSGIPPERALAQRMELARSAEKLARTRACPVCGSSFIPRVGQLRAGHGKFCSQSCNGASRKLFS